MLEVGVCDRWGQDNTNHMQDNRINCPNLSFDHNKAQLHRSGLHPFRGTSGPSHHTTRPPKIIKDVPSPSSQSIETCIDAEEAYQKGLRDKERPLLEDEDEAFQDMELEFVPETQENGPRKPGLLFSNKCVL
ncbi:hypothetical protein RIF29_25556 [Crotalaria pallida]|uniref:Uncharacterized protein n=1 Tax=Crotalaria pallida TaxID=3830 RepID=A0AAN9I171_CROPI